MLPVLGLACGAPDRRDDQPWTPPSGGGAGEDPGDTDVDPDSGDVADDGGIDDGGPQPSPYQGGWDIGTCQDSITPGPGIAPDFALTDLYGDTVRLYDFCHKAVFMTAGAFW